MNTGETLVYVTDCTLATVSRMVNLKSTTKSELKRQINIAQTGVDCIRDHNISCRNTRVEDILLTNLTVRQWSELEKFQQIPE